MVWVFVISCFILKLYQVPLFHFLLLSISSPFVAPHLRPIGRSHLVYVGVGPLSLSVRLLSFTESLFLLCFASCLCFSPSHLPAVCSWLLIPGLFLCLLVFTLFFAFVSWISLVLVICLLPALCCCLLQFFGRGILTFIDFGSQLYFISACVCVFAFESPFSCLNAAISRNALLPSVKLVFLWVWMLSETFARSTSERNSTKCITNVSPTKSQHLIIDVIRCHNIVSHLFLVLSLVLVTFNISWNTCHQTWKMPPGYCGAVSTSSLLILPFLSSPVITAALHHSLPSALCLSYPD